METGAGEEEEGMSRGRRRRRRRRRKGIGEGASITPTNAWDRAGRRRPKQCDTTDRLVV